MDDSERSSGIREEERRQAARPALHRHPEPAASRLLPHQASWTESRFEEGFGMDGSSIRGWAAINESDMLLIPDPTTAFMDPFAETPHAGDVRRRQGPHHQAALRARPALDRAEGRAVPARTAASPTPLTSAPKPSSSSSTTSASTRTSTPASTSSTPRKAAGTPAARENNLGYRPRYKEGYFPVPPTDHYQDLRSEMVQTMIRVRPQHRVPPPRSRHRRAVRDRSALRHAGEDRPTT